MKNRSCLIFSAFLATSLFAQQATNVPPSAPAAAGTITTNVVPRAAATNVPPPAKAEKKKSSKQPTKAKKKAPGSELRTVPLVAGPAVVIASNVNVRGQAKLKSEVVARLTKGQPVTVLEEVTLTNSAPDEPSAW